MQDSHSLSPEQLGGSHSVMGANSRNLYGSTRLGDYPDDEHPSRRLPPVDLLFLIDNSGSIGMVNFQVGSASSVASELVKQHTNIHS